MTKFDAERMLKQQLADLHVMYHRQADPILRQLAHIEAMKPPRPIWLDAAMLDPQMLAAMKRAPADTAEPSPLERLTSLEHEREQLHHLLRMVRSAAGNSLPKSLAGMIDRELGNA